MTTTRPEVDPAAAREVAAAKRRLTLIRDKLAKSRETDDALRLERDAIVCRLRDDGIVRADIAELAGVSVDMIKLILSRRNGDG